MVATALSPRVERSLANDWAEAVMHVLAHVRETAHLAPSVFDAVYVEELATALGPSRDRPLAEDAELLGRLLPSFEALARAQLLAWLFRSRARAAASAGRDLAELGPADVDAPELLAEVQRARAAAEILRAAAELEGPLLACLPPIAIDEAALADALSAAVLVAPRLASCTVGVIRALRLRGRILGDAIWVGAATVDHMAWQAAHEATVGEIVHELAAAGEPHTHARVEREALHRLAARARSAGREASHRAWLTCFADDYGLGAGTSSEPPGADTGARSAT